MYLYLLTNCQIKYYLPKDDTLPFGVTLGWIAEAQKSIPADECFDHYILTLAERKAIIEIMHEFTCAKKIGPSRLLQVGCALQEDFFGVLYIVTQISDVLEYKFPNGFYVREERAKHCYRSKCLWT